MTRWTTSEASCAITGKQEGELLILLIVGVNVFCCDGKQYSKNSVQNPITRYKIATSPSLW